MKYSFGSRRYLSNLQNILSDLADAEKTIRAVEQKIPFDAELDSVYVRTELSKVRATLDCLNGDILDYLRKRFGST